MDEGSRRGKDLAKPRERSGPAVSGFGMITGLEGCYVRLAVEVVRVAVEDYMDLLRLHMNRARYSRWYYTKHRRELDRAKTFLQSNRCKKFCNVDGEYLMRLAERRVASESEGGASAVSRHYVRS